MPGVCSLPISSATHSEKIRGFSRACAPNRARTDGGRPTPSLPSTLPDASRRASFPASRATQDLSRRQHFHRDSHRYAHSPTCARRPESSESSRVPTRSTSPNRMPARSSCCQSRSRRPSVQPNVAWPRPPAARLIAPMAVLTTAQKSEPLPRAARVPMRVRQSTPQCREAVRDNQCGATFHQGTQSVLNQTLTFCIERRSGFIQN